MSDTPAFYLEEVGRTGLTPTAGLGVPHYVIRATFVHPVTGTDTPLPPHHWLLVEDLWHRVVATSKASDPATGVAVLNDVGDGLPAQLVLGFVPAPADVRKALFDTGEAWIDLDKNDWAVSYGASRNRLVPAASYLREPWSAIRCGP